MGWIGITPEIDGDLGCAVAGLLLLYRSMILFDNQFVCWTQRAEPELAEGSAYWGS